MAAAPDQVDPHDFLARARPYITDPVLAAQLVDLILEVIERRRADTPKHLAKFQRLRLAWRQDAELAAAGVPRAERVRQLEGYGYSRALAYALTRPKNVDDSGAEQCESQRDLAKR